MIAAVRAAIVGIVSAVVAPFWLSPKRLAFLTRSAEGGQSASTVAERSSELRRARRFSDRMLARLPRPFWRNSCLYRSIAGCLSARWFGFPATVVVGVRRAGEKVQAHAWVAIDGAPFPPADENQPHPDGCDDGDAFQPLVGMDSQSRA